MMALPPLLPVPNIHERLQTIFPEGTENRNYVTREMAAKTVFVVLYIGAVDGAGCWLRPDQVTRMTDAQARLDACLTASGWMRSATSASYAGPSGHRGPAARADRAVRRGTSCRAGADLSAGGG